MCIRDRRPRERKTGAVVIERDQLGNARPIRRAVALGAIHPVSYTHLRAHETVLDLVCRLLLEKKNHKTQLTFNRVIITTISTHFYNSSLHDSSP